MIKAQKVVVYDRQYSGIVTVLVVISSLKIFGGWITNAVVITLCLSVYEHCYISSTRYLCRVHEDCHSIEE